MGRPKARVLPEPVRPRPSTSLPASASGMVAAWIGNGSPMPSAPSAATRFAGTPRSAKPRDAACRVGTWGAGKAGFREDWPSDGGVHAQERCARRLTSGSWARGLLAGLAGMTSQFLPAWGGRLSRHVERQT